jgi:heme exporter protein D
MTWGSVSNFFSMGGYALYVWGSYGVVVGLLVTEVVLLVMRRRNILNQLGLMARERRHRQSGAA